MQTGSASVPKTSKSPQTGNVYVNFALENTEGGAKEDDSTSGSSGNLQAQSAYVNVALKKEEEESPAPKGSNHSPGPSKHQNTGNVYANVELKSGEQAVHSKQTDVHENRVIYNTVCPSPVLVRLLLYCVIISQTIWQ